MSKFKGQMRRLEIGDWARHQAKASHYIDAHVENRKTSAGERKPLNSARITDGIVVSQQHRTLAVQHACSIWHGHNTALPVFARGALFSIQSYFVQLRWQE
jgi:hypothetical protein